MKYNILVKIVTAGLLVAVVTAGTMGTAEAQKFRFRDLFKKTNASGSSSGSTAKKEAATEEQSSPAEEKEKPEQDGENSSSEGTESAKKNTADSAGADKAKASSTVSSQAKVISNSDRLKSLTSKLDKADSDPDALLRSATARLRKEMKNSNNTKEPAAVARPKEAAKTPAEENKPVPTQDKVAAVAKPTSSEGLVSVVEKTDQVSKAPPGDTVARTPRMKTENRPPSLAQKAAVSAASEPSPKELQQSLAANNVPPPKPLVPAKVTEKKKEASNEMRIRSDEVEMDNENRTTTFIGNVDLQHPSFLLRGDRLVIFMNDEDEETEAPFKKAVATGPKVVVERINDKGGKDVGQSRKVVYDAVTGDLVLSEGPPQLQSGGSLVTTSSNDATITLKRDGNHSVYDRGAKAGTTVVIPIKGKAGDKSPGGPNLIPNKFDDISSDRKK